MDWLNDVLLGYDPSYGKPPIGITDVAIHPEMLELR
jgi:hypothetical protein